MENSDMVTYLKKQEKINVNQILNWAIEIARGIKYLHNKKMIHKDIAARNILLNGNKKCKISDFGLSLEGEIYNYSIRMDTKPVSTESEKIDLSKNHNQNEMSELLNTDTLLGLVPIDHAAIEVLQ